MNPKIIDEIKDLAPGIISGNVTYLFTFNLWGEMASLAVSIVSAFIITGVTYYSRKVFVKWDKRRERKVNKDG